MAQKYVFIIGTRPNYIKAAILQKEMDWCECYTIDTGQHYSPELVNQELSLTINYTYDLNSDNIFQAAYSIAEHIESLGDQYDAIVFGDTRSTLIGAIAAKRAHNVDRLIHVESGLRANDFTMPEEINRLFVDAISDIDFAPDPIAYNNLHIKGDKYIVGSLMIDSLAHNAISDCIEEDYYVATMHREENLTKDNIAKFAAAISGLSTVYFFSHPRLRKQDGFELLNIPNVQILPSIPYPNMLNILSKCKGVITDSGGVYEESAFMMKPVVIFRNSNEREFIYQNYNRNLLSKDPDKIKDFFGEEKPVILNSILEESVFSGKAAYNISKILREKYAKLD